MAEVFLSEEDEEALKRHVHDQAFMALLIKFVENSRDPIQALDDLKAITLDLIENASHSDDPDTNDYSRRFSVGIAQHYFDQFKPTRIE